MFKLLLEKLDKDNLLDETVIVAFSDHLNKLLLTENETELLNETIFFIYNNQMESNQIYNISSTINILPTIVNLFNLDNNYVYSGYDILDNTDSYVIFKDYTYYDGNEIKDINKDMHEMLKYSSNILISNYYSE